MSKPVHIAVNCRLLLGHRLEGIGRFSYEVLKRMVERNPEVHFSFFFDRRFPEEFVFGENVSPYVLPPQARHPLLWHTWFHAVLPWKMRQLKPDLFFSPEFYLSAYRKIPQIPVFHDIAYEHFPEDIPKLHAWHYQRYSPRYARQAAEILTVSEFSKQDIVQQYQLPPEKIQVVYNGVSDQFSPLSAEGQQAVRDRFTGGKPYFHFVGAIHPRKNLQTLLPAFDRFKAETDSPVQLLLVGRKGWHYGPALEAYEQMKHKDEVHFTGFVPDEELSALYAASLALCYVPYFEGFGIPILEAFRSETAVITSRAASMPEVAGDAALLVDPHDEKDIAQAMMVLWGTKGLREGLIQKGRIQGANFSWDRTYERVWKVLERWG